MKDTYDPFISKNITDQISVDCILEEKDEFGRMKAEYEMKKDEFRRMKDEHEVGFPLWFPMYTLVIQPFFLFLFYSSFIPHPSSLTTQGIYVC